MEVLYLFYGNKFCILNSLQELMLHFYHATECPSPSYRCFFSWCGSWHIYDPMYFWKSTLAPAVTMYPSLIVIWVFVWGCCKLWSFHKTLKFNMVKSAEKTGTVQQGESSITLTRETSSLYSWKPTIRSSLWWLWHGPKAENLGTKKSLVSDMCTWTTKEVIHYLMWKALI
jgi:hypothetical protein